MSDAVTRYPYPGPTGSDRLMSALVDSPSVSREYVALAVVALPMTTFSPANPVQIWRSRTVVIVADVDNCARGNVRKLALTVCERLRARLSSNWPSGSVKPKVPAGDTCCSQM